MKINYVWIVSPLDYSHSHAFDEVAQSISQALQALGHPAKIVHEQPPREISLVFGAHLAQKLLPPEFIIFNTEQMKADSLWMRIGYPKILNNHQIWDYSAENVQILKDMKLNVQHCEIGYMPCMTNIPRAVEKDIDVLFYGSPAARRDKLMDGLSKKCKAVYKGKVYGKERDDLIARAKIVLNLHFYDNGIFEIFRCAHLMANSKCIISEPGSDDKLEKPYYGAVNFIAYDEIIDTCLEILSGSIVRREWEMEAFKRFSSKSQIKILKPILEKIIL